MLVGISEIRTVLQETFSSDSGALASAAGSVGALPFKVAHRSTSTCRYRRSDRASLLPGDPRTVSERGSDQRRVQLRRWMTNPARLRKRLLEAEATTSAGTDHEINIVGCAAITFSSESAAHPIEHLFDGNSGPGTTRWI